MVGISLEKDQEVLLMLRDFLLKGNRYNRGPYALWNASDPSPCDWNGITCGNGRVTEINLRESSISGEIFGGFSELTELSRLDLSKNTICGAIPTDLNQCRRLKYLNLSHNIIEGPLNLSGLSELEVLDVTLNRLNGSIQSNFAEFCTNLVVFNISINRFGGGIRDLFDRCPRLRFLDLSSNMFVGHIWQGFSNLQEFSVSGNNITGVITADTFPSNCSLSQLDLSQNNLSGTFPDSISNCRNLTNLNIWGNRFSGMIPPGIGSLQELEYLFLGNNIFDRRIPEQLLNCSKLASLDLSKNNFGPEVQGIFGRFTQVKFLMLQGNNYSQGIESSGILTLKNILRLDLSFNNFSGQLPIEIAQMPQLKFLILAYNNFSGHIPPAFGNITTLQALDLSHNMLSGPIPPSLGNLTSLLWLTLADNSLTGQIPPEIGNCRSLMWLNLANNQLSGEIPLSIAEMGSSPGETFELNRRNSRISASSGECLAMRRWLPAEYPPFSFVHTLMNRKNCRRTWDNLLSGRGIISICLNQSSRSRTLNISGYIQLTGNRLTGEIPVQIGKMTWLSLIHLNRNRFSGRLPDEIGKLPLVVLNVSTNLLSGPIPSTVGDLRCLQNLDLSLNNFSGELPQALNYLSELNMFNVSFNPFLAGVIPTTGQLGAFDDNSFLGNPLIKRSHTNQSSPPTDPSLQQDEGAAALSRRMVAFWIFFAISVALFFSGFLILAFCVVGRRRSSNAAPSDDPFPREGSSSSKRWHGMEASSSSSTATSGASFDAAKVIRLDKAVSFSYLDIVAATRGFSDDMVIGRGGFGVVYRGVLPDGRPVAVKKLQRQGPEGEREFQAEMEVLCRGRAGGWPHPNLVALFGWCLLGAQKLLVYEYMQGGSLEDVIADWAQLGWEGRLAVAAGVARALVFLHHECFPAVVHRDVKASNVLLDGAGRARVTDFGLARVVRPGDSHVSTVVAGTVGYVAPEYGHTWHATTKGDVYSFGVLAMELATGRRALDGDDECLVELVRRVSREGRQGAAVVVPVRLPGMEPGDGTPTEGLGAMGKLLGLGLRCTEESPQARPSMKQVLEDLLDIINPSPPGKPPETSLAVSALDGGGRDCDILACTV